MAIGFISDLHANGVALVAVLEELERRGVDRIVCLGDIVDMGPNPSEVVGILRQRGIESIGGNHDPLDEEPGYTLLRDIEAWSRDQLSAADRAWLEALPFSLKLELGGHRVLAVHGSPRADDEDLLPTRNGGCLEVAVRNVDADLVVCGHTHVQAAHMAPNVMVVNVGSVGMPFEKVFDGSPPVCKLRCDFAIVGVDDNGELQVELASVPLDFEAYAASVRRAEMPHVEQWLSHWESRD